MTNNETREPAVESAEIESAEVFAVRLGVYTNQRPRLGSAVLEMAVAIKDRDAAIDAAAYARGCADERKRVIEECARLADDHNGDGDDVSDPSIMAGWWDAARAIAEEIRALATRDDGGRS